jgi:hypothetical protein
MLQQLYANINQSTAKIVWTRNYLKLNWAKPKGDVYLNQSKLLVDQDNGGWKTVGTKAEASTSYPFSSSSYASSWQLAVFALQRLVLALV